MASAWKVLQMVAILCLIAATKSECQVIRQGCREKCGNVTIPYPFGLNKDCSLNDNFTLVCNDTIPGGPKPFLPRMKGGLDIIDISLDGTLRKHTYVAYDCYTKQGERSYKKPYSTLPTFYYSATRNKLTAVGCDTILRFAGSAHDQLYGSGCISMCYNKSSVTSGACSGIGCCQAPIPNQLSRFRAFLFSDYNHSNVWAFNPCSYAFIADINYFNFSTDSLENMPHIVPSVVDWAVGDLNCTQAAKNSTSYACKDRNGYCRESDNGPAYRCFCKSGYTGNAYIQGGCLDVDECEAGQNNCS